MLKEVFLTLAVVVCLLLVIPVRLLFHMNFFVLYADMALLIIMLAFTVMDVIELDRKREYHLRNYLVLSLFGAIVLFAVVCFLILPLVAPKFIA